MAIKAVIKGKVASTERTLNERLEDLMTSNIFQNLSYVPFDDGLKLLLKCVRNINNHQIDLSDFDNLLKVDYRFWPMFTLENNRKCEPDLLIFFEKKNRKKGAILVEVKLYSGKSSEGRVDKENNYILNSDQLEKEWNVLNKNLIEYDYKYLIYLTKDILPKTEIMKSEQYIGKKGIIYHTNYFNLYKEIKENIPNDIIAKILPLKDILMLLEYYNFSGFLGWKNSDYTLFYKHYKKIFLSDKKPVLWNNIEGIDKIEEAYKWIWKN